MTRTCLTEAFIRDWAAHICPTDESRVMMTEELRALVDKAYDDGLGDGRAEMYDEMMTTIKHLMGYKSVSPSPTRRDSVASVDESGAGRQCYANEEVEHDI